MKGYIYLTLLLLVFTQCNNSYPRKLSGVEQTIEVKYINWACDCPDFVEVKFYDREDMAVYCFYIEAAKFDLKLPDSFYSDNNYLSKRLRLTGQFYLDEGISRTYEWKTSKDKIDKGRVFRYDKIEVIDETKPPL